MADSLPPYGLWPLVIIVSLVLIFIAASFMRPKTPWDWRALGVFSAFIVALFTEMYGFPLTIYLLSGWLSSRFPGMDIYSHDMGHLLEDLFGWGGDPHFGPFHIASYILIFYGFGLLSKAWKVLYAAFVIIMVGFLLQWPTLITLIMFPILVWLYVRLARSEEQESRAAFGDE